MSKDIVDTIILLPFTLSDTEIQSAGSKNWCLYVDKSVTPEMLDELTVEFLAMFNKCPSKLRKRVMQEPGVNASAMISSDKTGSGTSKDSSTSQQDARKIRKESLGSTPPKPGNVFKICVGSGRR